MISSQRPWPLDHEAGLVTNMLMVWLLMCKSMRLCNISIFTIYHKKSYISFSVFCEHTAWRWCDLVETCSLLVIYVTVVCLVKNKTYSNVRLFPLLKICEKVFKRSTHLIFSKGKVHPRTGHEGLYGEYSFFNLGAGSGGWSTAHPSRFNPGKDLVPIV